MRGWIKCFEDGTRIVGSDNVTNRGLVSWSKGRMIGLCRVESWQNNQCISISGAGSYWQSDDFDIRIHSTQSDIAVRRIQRLVKETDVLINCIKNEFYFTDKIMRGYVIKIEPKHHNKWFTVELNCYTGQVTYGFQENKV